MAFEPRFERFVSRPFGIEAPECLGNGDIPPQHRGREARLRTYPSPLDSTLYCREGDSFALADFLTGKPYRAFDACGVLGQSGAEHVEK